MYKAEFSKSFVKDLKKVSHEVQLVVLDKWVPQICENPSLGRSFKGKRLNLFLKLAFRYRKNDYRIVYTVDKGAVTIVFLAIGSRENFYSRFDKRV